MSFGREVQGATSLSKTVAGRAVRTLRPAGRWDARQPRWPATWRCGDSEFASSASPARPSLAATSVPVRRIVRRGWRPGAFTSSGKNFGGEISTNGAVRDRKKRIPPEELAELEAEVSE